MTMMRIRGVWTANAAAFLLGAGMYSAFIIIPQFAELPTSTGFGFGASVVVAGLYLLPSTVGMMVMSLQAGRLAARYGSRLVADLRRPRSPPCAFVLLSSPTATPSTCSSARP